MYSTSVMNAQNKDLLKPVEDKEVKVALFQMTRTNPRVRIE